MYLSLDKKFLEKTKEKAIQQDIDDGGEGHSLLWSDLEDTIDRFEIIDDNLFVSVSSKAGYISFEIPIDHENMETLLLVVLKKLNKLKTLIESTKGL